MARSLLLLGFVPCRAAAHPAVEDEWPGVRVDVAAVVACGFGAEGFGVPMVRGAAELGGGHGCSPPRSARATARALGSTVSCQSGWVLAARELAVVSSQSASGSRARRSAATAGVAVMAP